MKLSVIHRTEDYRGDHSADIEVAHELRPGETVEQLAERLKLADGAQRGDVIEIRAIAGGDGPQRRSR